MTSVMAYKQYNGLFFIVKIQYLGFLEQNRRAARVRSQS